MLGLLAVLVFFVAAIAVALTLSDSAVRYVSAIRAIKARRAASAAASIRPTRPLRPVMRPLSSQRRTVSPTRGYRAAA
ncbi:hypothetical protein GRI38_02810 [Altererythrobacter aurantiacus]|uniref:Uncharacterized protein n=1 Tax=Parapontixanthobacter aurantiacus TaxID=1463599 RepID=A0A844ZDE9_9SPHN|nr:hypothetical protein [Parapontixanthobacter aurantiacus]MXO84960.1 hypothetical protein [Parapontixanthobacter aurantiacus]